MIPQVCLRLAGAGAERILQVAYAVALPSGGSISTWYTSSSSSAIHSSIRTALPDQQALGASATGGAGLVGRPERTEVFEDPAGLRIDEPGRGAWAEDNGAGRARATPSPPFGVEQTPSP